MIERVGSLVVNLYLYGASTID